MSVFSTIMDKIFHHGAAARPAPEQPAPAQASTSPESTPGAQPAPVQMVDVEAVLSDMASKRAGGGNWQSSIVDLLKLLDLDSSLDARKQLANVHVGVDGSAEENVALHRAVMQKLEENGGQVPSSLKG